MSSDPAISSQPQSPAAPSGRRRPKKRLRQVFFVGLPLIAIGLTTTWMSQTSVEAAASPESPPPPTVTVETVEQRLLAEYAERIGRVVATELVELRPEVSGRITGVHFASGQLVEAGQVLFTIDPRPYAAAAEAARAEVARAEARANSARREAERATALRAQRAISEEEAQLRQSRSAETRAELLAAQAALKTAELDLARTQVRAPISGRASRAFVTEGNIVSGSPMDPTLLTTIVSTGEAHVYVNVDEATIHSFRQARAAGVLPTDVNGRIPVELRLDQSETYTHRGFVESLDNRIDPETGSLTVRLYFKDPLDQLLPGSFVRVRVPVSAVHERLLISERAIGTDQSQKFVLAVRDDHTVAYRPVELGPMIDDMRIIKAGVAAGDRIIVNGLQRIRPGMVVNATSASTTGPTSVAVR